MGGVLDNPLFKGGGEGLLDNPSFKGGGEGLLDNPSFKGGLWGGGGLPSGGGGGCSLFASGSVDEGLSWGSMNCKYALNPFIFSRRNGSYISLPSLFS